MVNGHGRCSTKERDKVIKAVNLGMGTGDSQACYFIMHNVGLF